MCVLFTIGCDLIYVVFHDMLLWCDCSVLLCIVCYCVVWRCVVELWCCVVLCCVAVRWGVVWVGVMCDA